MVQRYTEIPSSEKIRDSLQPLLNNDKTAISCNSGTTFPTTNVFDGMLCFRTDEKKLYQLIDINDLKNGWKLIADLNGEFRHIEGGAGNAINYDAKDLNLWQKMPTGFYEGTNMLNAPEGDKQWRVLQFRHGNSDGWATQLAFSFNHDIIMVRTEIGGDWTPWGRIFSGSTSGEVIKGMNAEKVSGYKPGNDSGQIAINNGVLNTRLNADMVDGLHAGNGSNQVSINNGTVNSNLNADMVDGIHAGNGSGQLAVNNGTLNKNLNAEMIGGFRASELVKIAGDGKVNNLQVSHSNSQTSKISNVDGLDYNVYTTPRQTTTKFHRCKVDTFDDTYDVFTDSGGSGDLTLHRTFLTVDTLPELTGNGNYNINTILKALVKASHSHQVIRERYKANCNCDCRCDCDCNDDNCGE
ncbi:pyocin knob domain-containing protein [Parasutterella muris]|uniref:Uncharacterized protein n=1 Tax=Parasutterella muris TaxID=2565572 RepID=A0A6L6YMG1_9BURK|nr:pyocin knob domain-containing protein [Parasutterella muris]MVX56361.1 hypothetical protein [Parasutterella muris]